MAKSSFSKTFTKKKEEAQQTRIPPEAPTEGQKSNLSNLLGANFWIPDVKTLLFCLLQIENTSIALLNFEPNGFPYFTIINTTNIPAEYVPITSTH